MPDASPDNPWTGGCQCGAVRYELSGPPVNLYVCHCRECRKQSASAFGVSLIVRRKDFRLTQGETKHWARPTDTGKILHCHFCAVCGSRVFHEGAAARETISIKGGSLDQMLDLGKAIHIWTTRKLPGLPIPEQAVRFPQEPDEDD